ncbi:hypothetical protein IWX91DRAFT_193596 [Phyllosticta citricarpa]
MYVTMSALSYGFFLFPPMRCFLAFFAYSPLARSVFVYSVIVQGGSLAAAAAARSCRTVGQSIGWYSVAEGLVDWLAGWLQPVSAAAAAAAAWLAFSFTACLLLVSFLFFSFLFFSFPPLSSNVHSVVIVAVVVGV